MSARTRAEKAMLDGISSVPDTSVASGLTYGGSHPEHVLVADNDEAARIKAGIVREVEGGKIASGLTYGSPAFGARQQAVNAETLAQGQAIQSREEADRQELALRREIEAFETLAELVWEGAQAGDTEAQVAAIRGFKALDADQQRRFLEAGDVTLGDVDWLMTTVAPVVEQHEIETNATMTQAHAVMQKGLAYVALKAESGLSDAAWDAHAQAVFALARDRGVELNDPALGSVAFEQGFRSFEIVAAEDARADAEARFKADVLNAPSTNVNDGLRVLTGNGWMDVQEGGPVPARPDYEKAAQRVLGGLPGGHPMHDNAEAIRGGILAEHVAAETSEMKQVQAIGDDLFAASASVKAKLGQG